MLGGARAEAGHDVTSTCTLASNTSIMYQYNNSSVRSCQIRGFIAVLPYDTLDMTSRVEALFVSGVAVTWLLAPTGPHLAGALDVHNRFAAQFSAALWRNKVLYRRLSIDTQNSN